MNIKEARIRSFVGTWTWHEWRPEPDHVLAPVVASVAHCEGAAVFPRERVFPDTCIELIVHVGEPHRLVTPAGAAPLPAVSVSGIRLSPLVLEAPSGSACGLSLRLRPTGTSALLGIPLPEISGLVLDLTHHLGAAAGQLADLCEDAHSATERIRRTVRWLTSRVKGASPAPPASSAITWAAGRIEREGGAGSIGDLQARTGLSWSRFTTAFREQVGITPKRYARVARFRRALSLLHEGKTATLSAAALQAGYHDQAHMNAEFRSLAGLTPGEFQAAPRVPNWISVLDPTR